LARQQLLDLGVKFPLLFSLLGNHVPNRHPRGATGLNTSGLVCVELLEYALNILVREVVRNRQTI
jgi:hypothetical protein